MAGARRDCDLHRCDGGGDHGSFASHDSPALPGFHHGRAADRGRERVHGASLDSAVMAVHGAVLRSGIERADAGETDRQEWGTLVVAGAVCLVGEFAYSVSVWTGGAGDSAD